VCGRGAAEWGDRGGGAPPVPALAAAAAAGARGSEWRAHRDGARVQAAVQHQGRPVQIPERQSAREQVQESARQHTAVRGEPRLPAARGRRARRQRLHKREFH